MTVTLMMQLMLLRASDVGQTSSKTELKDKNVTFVTRICAPLIKFIEYLNDRSGDETLLFATYSEYSMEIKTVSGEIDMTNKTSS